MRNPHSPDGMASDTANVDFLLATYDGAAFLAAQLASILAQTHKNWRLVIRDDGSTDKTPEIIEAFRARHPGRVVVLEDEAGNLGLVQTIQWHLDNQSWWRSVMDGSYREWMGRQYGT